MECLPNKLTPFNFKIYYKEKNYLKVKTVSFKYITPSHSKGFNTLVYWYASVLSILYTYIPMFQTYIYTEFYYMTWLPLIP